MYRGGEEDGEQVSVWAQDHTFWWFWVSDGTREEEEGGELEGEFAGTLPLEDEPLPRYYHTACTVEEGRVMVFGGCSGTEVHSDTHVLQRAGKKWVVVCLLMRL